MTPSTKFRLLHLLMSYSLVIQGSRMAEWLSHMLSDQKVRGSIPAATNCVADIFVVQICTHILMKFIEGFAWYVYPGQWLLQSLSQ